MLIKENFGFFLAVFWCTYLSARAQTGCSVPSQDEPKDTIDALLGPKSIRKGPPRGQIRKLIRGGKMKSAINEAKKSLKFCDARKEKFSIPNLPPSLVASEVCSPRDTQISIPYQVYSNGAYCWVLKPWAGYTCNYVSCTPVNCDVPRPPPAIPVSDQYKCKPTNYRILTYYAICMKKPFGFELKAFTIRLPQCCSCIKFRCTFKG